MDVTESFKFIGLGARSLVATFRECIGNPSGARAWPSNSKVGVSTLGCLIVIRVPGAGIPGLPTDLGAKEFCIRCLIWRSLKTLRKHLVLARAVPTQWGKSFL
jgi:hypothetical protein